MRELAAPVVLAVAVLASPATAGAHAVLVNSIPAARMVLSYPPGRVDLWFNERLEPAWSTLSVWSASGTQVDRRDTIVSPEDPKRLSVTLGTLGPGMYTVRFRVLSVDAHVVESSFVFTVEAKP
jgi:methionine-rich copper-binding protein CopC